MARHHRDTEVQEDKRTEFVQLFEEFVKKYAATSEGQIHNKAYEQTREQGRRNFEEIVMAANRGEDVTEQVLLRMLPYTDSAGNREKEAWITIASAVTGDIKGWFQEKKWTKPEDWPHIAQAILRFVRRCNENPVDLQAACEEFVSLPYSKGFQAGMLSPILNALRPDDFILINNKSRRVINYFANTSYGHQLTDYPATNTTGSELIGKLAAEMHRLNGPDIRDQDLFDMFSHWLVAVKKFDFGTVRYWKIAPGENAWNWDACREGGFIAIGWEALGDVSGLSRSDFEVRRDELVAKHDDWTKAGADQVWKFSQIKAGDRIVANRATTEVVGIGTVVGPYYFVEGQHYGHRLPVEWEDVAPRPVQKGGWRRTLVELSLREFRAIYDAPPRRVEFPNFWWVCQGKSYTEERGKKFLWAPKAGAGTSTPHHWKNIERLEKGDIVFNYAQGAIRGVSIVDREGYDFSDKESENWSQKGIRVDIEHYELDPVDLSKLRPAMGSFSEALKDKIGPFDVNGDVKQGYLFEFSRDAAQIIREVYGNSLPEPIEKYFEMKLPTKKNTWREIKDLLSINNLSHDFKIGKLYFENKHQIEKRVQAALKNGDNIMLIGPPGTGKSKLAKEISEYYCGEHGYFMSTATSDWSTFETIGGYRPDSQAMLKFYPGIFLQCFQNQSKGPINRWLIIDEINRADIDKAFGSLFSALTGDDISLPFEVSGEPLEIIGKPMDDTEIKDNLFIVPPDWRIIATMNTYDKASLYEMSYAFMRRFAFVPVDVPSQISSDLVKKYLDIWGLEVNEKICSELSDIWSKVNERRKIGPAIIEDMYRHVRSAEPYDYASAIIMYVFPQFEGLVEDEQIQLISDITLMDFMNNKDELKRFASDFFDLDIDKFN
ncbi:MAG: AAA family ATPase [Candidatus Hodarchaeota archaeon]